MEHAEILPQLFLGSHPQTTGDIDRLRQQSGISAVVNLQTDEDMCSVGLAWEPLAAHYSTCGIELCRVPVRDFDPIDLREKLPECVRRLDGLLAAGHLVYLHCTAGAGRSPTVAIAYLHWCRGWDLDAAVADVKERWHCSPNVEAIRQAVWDTQAQTSPGPVQQDGTC